MRDAMTSSDVHRVASAVRDGTRYWVARQDEIGKYLVEKGEIPDSSVVQEHLAGGVATNRSGQHYGLTLGRLDVLLDAAEQWTLLIEETEALRTRVSADESAATTKTQEWAVQIRSSDDPNEGWQTVGDWTDDYHEAGGYLIALRLITKRSARLRVAKRTTTITIEAV